MKQMHILDQMKPEEVAELKAQSVTKTFQRREIIFHKEDTPKYLYVLLEGAVCVFDDTPDGSRWTALQRFICLLMKSFPFLRKR